MASTSSAPGSTTAATAVETGMVVAPAASSVNDNGDGSSSNMVPAGAIAVMGLIGVAILLLCLCISEVRSSVRVRRRQNRRRSNGDLTDAVNDQQVAGSNPNPLSMHSLNFLPVTKFTNRVAPILTDNISNDSAIKAAEITHISTIKELTLNPQSNGDHEAMVKKNLEMGCNNNNITNSINHECAVCLASFEDGDEIRVLPGCCHTFHVACIDSWLAGHSPTCPLCRMEIRSAIAKAKMSTTQNTHQETSPPNNYNNNNITTNNAISNNNNINSNNGNNSGDNGVNTHVNQDDTDTSSNIYHDGHDHHSNPHTCIPIQPIYLGFDPYEFASLHPHEDSFSSFFSFYSIKHFLQMHEHYNTYERH